MDAIQRLDLQRIVIKQLSSEPIDLFRCGDRDIDDWVQKKARQLADINRVKIFCACLDDGQSVQGFYALSFESKDTKRLDSSLKQFPNTPVVYVTYIATVRSLQGQGLGSHLLIDALRRAYGVSQHIGFHGVALRSLNARTTALYRRFGFAVVDKNPNPLMLLPIQALADLFAPH